MAWITDSLTSAIRRVNPFARDDFGGALPNVFSHQLALASYMSSGMLRKVIAIPAADRTQKWRDWQTDKDAITLIEAEENRLRLRAKTKHAEILRGIGGGAMILVTAGDHDKPLNPETIDKGGLIAINVVSRWQIQAKDFDKDLASPTYGEPRMFAVSGDGKQQDIHPSRVVCFRGDPIPQGDAVADDEAFWGDSRLLRVFTEVRRSDDTQAWFAALVRKAKLLRIGIPDLLDLVATDAGKEQLNERVRLIAEGESVLNATVYRSGTGADDPGEKIDDYQVTWAGIPAMMDAFDQRVAAVSDIPFTRLMGRSPAGMNATGESDANNYNRMVTDGQENEVRPCLERIDPLLLRSAGVSAPEDVWWEWAPLGEPGEKEKAETFKFLMEAVEKLLLSGLVPEVALAEAVQNLIEERGDLPGLADALAKLSEDERFGGGEEEDDDPSALQVAPALLDPRQQQDAAPRSLYVSRKLLNADEFLRWAKAQGFSSTLDVDDLHVTVAYSKTPLDWMKVEGEDWNQEKDGTIEVPPGGVRIVEPLGDKGAVVLLFTSSRLSWRHEQIIRAGASHDFDEYQPHVTITYAKPDDLDLSKVEPFRGKLRFGPERFEEIVEDWESGRG